MWFDSVEHPQRWSAGVTHLCSVDPVMRRIIAATGPCSLAPRRDYFVVLCKAIFSQQISTIVAATLFGRFRNQFPQRRPTPPRVIDLILNDPPHRLASCGLSRQKQAYLLDLARHFANGMIPTPRLGSFEDERVIETLTAVKGIGRWTAEMFLIFVLNRPDVLPVDDLGLRKGVQLAYGLRETPNAAAVTKRAELWRPYRSLATWYLWRQPKVIPVPVTQSANSDGSPRRGAKVTGRGGAKTRRTRPVARPQVG